jgi:diaminohydroxyphosphoribosylaminopyrimidine deaminase/5-amino-6-(5-phosphoribosylamino)uracil reductase
VLDSGLRMPLSAGMLDLPGSTVLYCSRDQGREKLEAAGADVVTVAAQGDHVDVRVVLADLAARGVNDVLVEAGPTVSGYLLAEKLVDELVIYQAPHIMGSETKPMFLTPTWQALADRAHVEIRDLRRIGRDIRLTVRVVN